MASTVLTNLTGICDSIAKRADISDVSIKLHAHVSEINPKEWGAVVRSQNRFLCLDYLSALENSHDEGLELRYAIFLRDEIVVGAAAFQITHFTTSEDAYSGWFLKLLHRVNRFLLGKHVHNILICGNAIATGEHGFCISDDYGLQHKAAMIAKAMKDISAEEDRRGKRICAMVVKDFYPSTAPLADFLMTSRFRKFQVDHNMVMPLLPEWKSFEDYLNALNTKFRTKARASLNRSATLEMRTPSAEDIEQNLDTYISLYESVHEKADFRLGKLNLKVLSEMIRRLPGQFSVRSYYLNGELIGFLSAMRCGSILEAHVIGIDYNRNKEFGIYQRMLYDYIQLGIENGCNRIVFGRTAAEIKSTVGAFPVDLTCCILHQRRISNALLSLILQYVRPSVYPQRQPFKVDVLDKLMKMKLFD